MKFKCKINLHNWYIVESISEAQINSKDCICPASKTFVKKMCVNCRKYIDEITPAYRIIKKQIRKERRLQKFYKKIAKGLIHE